MLVTEARRRLQKRIHEIIQLIKDDNLPPSLSKRNFVLALIFAAIGKSYLAALRDSPRVYAQRNALTELIMALLSDESRNGLRKYRPDLTHLNGHVSTLLGFLRAAPPSIPSTRELIVTPDGGHFSLDWFNESLPGGAGGVKTAECADSLMSRPIVLILHGVHGHVNESYMRHMAHAISSRLKWRACCMQLRGCGDLSLTSAKSYDACKTEDIDQAITSIKLRFPSAPLFLCGFSLGANLVVKYLGEKGKAAKALVAAAVSISNPWCFLPSMDTMHYPKRNVFQRYVSKIYSMLLAHEYKKYVNRHLDSPLGERFRQEITKPLHELLTLRDLDEHVTVPLGGFRDLEHYMTESSCSEYLLDVQVPLLGINALDDPFISPEVLEYTVRKASQNPYIILVTTRQGGHIGWGEPFLHFWRSSWAEDLGVDYLNAVHRAFYLKKNEGYSDPTAILLANHTRARL